MSFTSPKDYSWRAQATGLGDRWFYFAGRPHPQTRITWGIALPRKAPKTPDGWPVGWSWSRFDSFPHDELTLCNIQSNPEYVASPHAPQANNE